MKNEPKTCWTCKHRRLSSHKDGKYHKTALYQCNEHRKYRADLGVYIPDIWDVSGRHWKCSLYEHK